jgi:hypothetical protein
LRKQSRLERLEVLAVRVPRGVRVRRPRDARDAAAGPRSVAERAACFARRYCGRKNRASSPIRVQCGTPSGSPAVKRSNAFC